MGCFQIIVAACLLFMLGCSPPQVESPPSTPVVEGDLLGTWELKYDGKTIFDKASGASVYGKGVEQITLLLQGRYQQIFDDGGGGHYPKIQSTWRLSKNYSGRQIVILDGLPNYKDGITAAVASPPAQSTSLLVETSSPMPFGKVKELILCFADADSNLCFGRSAKSTP